MATIKIKGFLPKAKSTAKGKTFAGRFTCPDVQWTDSGQDKFVTFTITAGEITAAAESNLLWTDQDVQRGIRPALETKPPRELPLSQGYPDTASYIFFDENADDIAMKLLEGERLFLNPLIWNLRPGTFEAFYDASKNDIYIYSGRVYLPDSHHRHQAIVKAVHVWREDPRAYPKFSDEQQFKVELYFLDREDEGNYFFDKNQRPRPTAKSKAFDLTTQDGLSVLAKKVIDLSGSLRGNVNRVTDRLDARNPQVMTLNTLRDMMRAFVTAEEIDSAELEGLAVVAARFYDLLSSIRPELGPVTLPERRTIRDTLIVDSAVLMHAYGALMRDFNNSQARLGTRKASFEWRDSLGHLSSNHRYRYGRWAGDLFDKKNPLWLKHGIVKLNKDGTRLTALNTGGARGRAIRVLRAVVAGKRPQLDLSALKIAEG